MNSKFRFTKDRLESIVPSSNRIRYRDEKVEGLVLDVLPSGRKSFRVYKRVKGTASPLNITLGQFPTLTIERARNKAMDALSKIAEGINPNESARIDEKARKTLQDVFDDYISSKKLSAATLKGYKQDLRCYLDDWRDRQLNSISEEEIKSRHKLVTKNSPARADHCMRMVRALFNFAMFEYRGTSGEKVFHENPVLILGHLKLWNRVARRQTRLLKSELKPWFDGIDSLRMDGSDFMSAVCDFCEIALFTGLRRSELLKLDWASVNMENRTFFVSRTKNGSPLELPIGDYVLELFKRRQQRTTNGYVFQADNSYGYVREPRKCILEIIKTSGIDFELHDLRRTFTSIAELLRVGTYTLKRLLNHKTQRSDVTAGYTVLTAEELREPIQKIEDHILMLAGRKKEQSAQDRLLALLDGLAPEKQQDLLSRIAKELS